MEELHRRFEMSDLITKRAKWVDEQLFQMSRWQVSGGSKVQRAIAAGEAFDIASGIRQLGVQKVPVASVAPTKALSTLTEDIDFLETFPYTERESRSQQRKLEKVPLLAMSKRVEQADQLLLQDIGTPRVIAFPLDDGAGTANNLAIDGNIVDSEDVAIKMDLGTTTTFELAIKGTPMEKGPIESSVVASEMGDNISIEWRQDMERYRWRQVSDGGKLPPAGRLVPTPESFQPEAYKPIRFRKRSTLRAMAWLTVSAMKSVTTSKLASYIQVQ